MLQIAICDDIPEQTLTLQNYIENYCKIHNIAYDLQVFISGKELLGWVKNLDIIFLDIEMPGLDGIETGKAIRRKNLSCKIIMATRMVERIKEAFYIEAFRFITKPFIQKEVEEALSAAVGRLLGNEKIVLYYNWSTHAIPQREIYYILTYDSSCEFLTKDRVLRSENSLADMEQQLDDKLFFRIHRKYIVNMLYIEDYKNGWVRIRDTTLPVSRRKRREFERVYMEFDIAYR